MVVALDESPVGHRGCVSEAAVADFQGCLLDALACALQARPAGDVRGVIRACTGGGSAPIWWHAATGDPVGTAFANAYAVHRLDYDSFHPATLGHPAAVVLPAALAAWSGLERPGSVVIEGYVSGVETMAALAAVFGADIRRRGAHPTVAIGMYGAAAATAAVLGLSPAGTDAAFDLCAALAPQGQVSVFGTRRKPLGVANAAQVGFRAASLAAAGVDAPGRPWLVDVMLAAGWDPEAAPAEEIVAAHGLLETAPSWCKELPLCGYLLPAISGLMATGLTIAPTARVTSIDVSVPPSVIEAGRGPAPASVDEARFSLEFAVLSALAAPGTEVYLSTEAFASARDAFTARGLPERLTIRAGKEEPLASILITLEGAPPMEARWPLSPAGAGCARPVGERKLVGVGRRSGVPPALLDRLVSVVDDFGRVSGSEFSRFLGRLGEASGR